MFIIEMKQTQNTRLKWVQVENSWLMENIDFYSWLCHSRKYLFPLATRGFKLNLTPKSTHILYLNTFTTIPILSWNQI